MLVYQDGIGTHHITRKYDAPEGRAGTRGAAATVIVHDNWYGSKKTIKFWIRHGDLFGCQSQYHTYQSNKQRKITVSKHLYV